MKLAFDIASIGIGAILTVTTIVYARITARMLGETKKMREAQTEPHIFITAQPADSARFIKNMVIQNIGPGPAYKLEFKVEPNIEIMKGHYISDINMIKHGLRCLAPNQKIQFMVANSIEEAKKEKKTLYKVTVTYQDKNGKYYEETFVLDFAEYFGMLYTDSDPYEGIIKKLGDIQRDIHGVIKIPDSVVKVLAYSKKDMEEEKERRIAEHKRMEERINKQDQEDK
jgi:hypothetical protein